MDFVGNNLTRQTLDGFSFPLTMKTTLRLLTAKRAPTRGCEIVVRRRLCRHVLTGNLYSESNTNKFCVNFNVPLKKKKKCWFVYFIILYFSSINRNVRNEFVSPAIRESFQPIND